MSVTAAMVKELRERTGSGMMECKKALVEANGDIELAIDNMRKAGSAKADKKAGRIAAEGLMGIKVTEDGKLAVMVEVNCETDFVAKSDDFIGFVNNIAEALLTNDVQNDEQLLNMVLASGESVDSVRRGLIAKLGENMTVRRFAKYTSENGGNAFYLHGSKIGVLVELTHHAVELGKHIAMHIAASTPTYVSPEQVSVEEVTREHQIQLDIAMQSGKPREIAEKMVEGRMKKFTAEISLLGQAFVMDPSKTVEQLLKENQNGVVRFARFEVGEGIEKVETDFAAEVAAMSK